ncbi:MAG: M18 family aminopeptidase [Victivallales bacterium]|nr:M18 family aminopeptidase [Victivallales bacterium]MCF7888757.1 M18 family aminopeptidase [Victivallales bacterium]
MKKKAEELVDLIYKSPTSFHAVETCRSILLSSGFEEINIEDSWSLDKGGRYFTVQNGSSLFAFRIGKKLADARFKIVGCHTDSPGLKVKPNPEMLSCGYLKINTEIYGGAVLNTWFDRPLSLAGRVYIKNKKKLAPLCRLVNINKPVAVLPNLAMHMNREVNKGVAIDNQKDILPVIRTVEADFEKDNFLLKLIAERLSVEVDDIIDFELYFYEYEKGRVIGLEEEFISSGRIDDLEAVFAGLDGIVNSAECEDSVNLLACFDNEEVGSSSKQGADSQLLSHLMERIVFAVSGEASNARENFLRAIPKSFIISVDGAHSVHPNKPEKSDPLNRPVINSGPVIKISANQKYTSDADSISVYKCLSEIAGVPYQIFVNHSNEKGGSTIGPINSTHLEMKAIDVGAPMFAMHSIREMCGVKDHSELIKLITSFYESEL